MNRFRGKFNFCNGIFGMLFVAIVLLVVYMGVRVYMKEPKAFGANKLPDSENTYNLELNKYKDSDLASVFELEEEEEEKVQEQEPEPEKEIVVDKKNSEPYFFSTEIYKYIQEQTDLFDLTNATINIDPGAYVQEEYIDLHQMTDFSFVTESTDEPQILIFHTHEYERYSDSKSRTEEDSVVGVGEALANALSGYGWSVMHDKTKYDILNGEVNTNVSYAQMEEGVTSILEQYPSIEVVIDIHRDGLPDDVKITADTFEKPTAKIMFVAGASCLKVNGSPQPLEEFPNQYIKENIAFALQMQLIMSEEYPSLCRKLLIKPYRYSLHMKPKSLLIEVGANTNTMEEAHNTVAPIADTLNKVLSYKN